MSEIVVESFEFVELVVRKRKRWIGWDVFYTIEIIVELNEVVHSLVWKGVVHGRVKFINFLRIILALLSVFGLIEHMMRERHVCVVRLARRMSSMRVGWAISGM